MAAGTAIWQTTAQRSVSTAKAEEEGQGLAERQWQQVLTRDVSASFVYAVRTTGIFCRPTCPSRRPQRAHVRFFADATLAAGAGFRACLRCQPDGQTDEAAAVQRIAAYLEKHQERNVPLAELGRLAGCSAGTAQRLFTRVLGLSPRTWVNSRRAETYRALLSNSAKSTAGGAADTRRRITDAIYDAGFSSPSRAHGAASLGMEARRFRARGAGEQIGYTLGAAPLNSHFGKQTTLGRMLVAATGRGVCAVLLGDTDAALQAELEARFPQAVLASDASLATHLRAVLDALGEHPSARELSLDLRGTAFQARVWAALRRIPRGETRSYAEVAREIGAPRSVRAVAGACGQNPAAILVPCHRVVGSDGRLAGYRWGLDRKQALLAHERSGEQG